MPRNIDVGLLRAFVVVAETGGMTSASRTLHLTQAAVSQQIKRLEELFGRPLFKRHNRQVSLTSTGERLLAYAQRMLSLNDECWGAMTSPEFEGEVRLGVPHDIVLTFMPSILRAFRQSWPRVQVTLVSDTTPILLEAMANNEIDLTLTTEAEAGDGEALLLEDRLVWVGAPNGEAAELEPLPVSLGGETCAFRSAAVQALVACGRDWRILCQVGSLEPVYATLQADLAIAPMLTRTVPNFLSILGANAGLPVLPSYYINLRLPLTGVSGIAGELASQIRHGFAVSYPIAA